MTDHMLSAAAKAALYSDAPRRPQRFQPMRDPEPWGRSLLAVGIVAAMIVAGVIL